MFVYCTPVHRVIQSTQSELLGLYPYINTQAVSDNYKRSWDQGRVPLNWRLDGGKFKKLPYMVQQLMDLRWFLFTIIWIKVSMTISVGRVAITQSRTDSTDILMKPSIKNFHLLSLIKWGNLLLQLSIWLLVKNKTFCINNSTLIAICWFLKNLKEIRADITSLECNGTL